MSIDICIQGAGIVGKTLALLLAKERIRVGLVKAPLPARQDARSFAFNAASRQWLQSIRAWPEQACAVQHMHITIGDEFDQRLSFDAPASSAQDVSALTWIVDAHQVTERLDQALSFSPEIQWLDAPASASLTVNCDGAGAQLQHFSYGQTAIAARLQTEQTHQNTARQWMRDGEICALLPRAEPSGNSVALVWSVSASKAQDLLAMPAEQFSEQLHRATGGQLGRLQLMSERAAWPLVLSSSSQWHGRSAAGAWVLAGDAAHRIHPLAGQGLNLGLADVAQLAELLSAKASFRRFDDARLLRQYERSRKAEALKLRMVTDGLFQLFAAQDARVVQLRQLGLQAFANLQPLKRWVMRQAAG